MKNATFQKFNVQLLLGEYLEEINPTMIAAVVIHSGI